MELTVSHRITTKFEPTRRRLVQSLRLFPTDCASQEVVDWRVKVLEGETGSDFVDGAGDRTMLISTGGEVSEQTIEISGVVRTFDTLGVLRDLKERVPPITYLTATRLTRPDADITALVKEAVGKFPEDKGLDRAHALAQAVTNELTEDREIKSGFVPASEVFEAGKGGAAEFTHVLIAAAHTVGIPARFVYGYVTHGPVELETDLGDEPPTNALVISSWPGHAWAELWIEGLGWVGFDTVKECCPDETYIRLCSGRDAMDASPFRATALGQGGEAQEVSLDVRSAAQ